MKKKGYALATILILLSVSLVGVGVLVSISALESKIARSHQEGTRAYYVAEAGVEDALWRLNTTSSYAAALFAGNLDETYTVNDAPKEDQGFTVTFESTAPQYGTIRVEGYSNNGTFQAKRKIVTNVFIGPGVGPTNGGAIMSGGLLSISNGSSVVTVSGGDIYATGSSETGGITVTQATVNLGTGLFRTPNSFSPGVGSTLVNGGIQASNYPPAAETVAIPGFDFSYYSTNNNASYTGAQFVSAIAAGGNTVTFPGPVTYVSSDIDLKNNIAKDKTIVINGMLVVNGSFTTYGAVQNLVINVNDPGNGQSGVFLRTQLVNGGGAWNVNGVLYASGNMSFSKSQAMTINGAIIAGSGLSINTADPFTVNYDSSRVTPVFGAGTPGPVEVQHWEEEY